ncbi:unnamed protein product [Thelazia callipaeda]|uniref:Uncharacterized protein n=1 Tax=Thelazia callipaeda TaxID=103827 RepID=A0A0N5CX33_THECL|nr:unnamed protein product [Thelazia callipaeda]
MEKHASEHKVPSAIGNFLSKISSVRHRSKSARNSSLYSLQDTTSQSCNNHSSAVNVTSEILSDDGKSITSLSAKPRRHSSPFVRIIHRMSMNRKTRNISVTNHEVHNPSKLNQNKLSSGTVHSVSSPSAAHSCETDMLSRPAVSESDLRLLTLSKDQEMDKSLTALSINTRDVYSENNLSAITRVPSYLRISCALNGYHHPYRRLDDSYRLVNSTPAKLPMSMVETRRLLFSGENHHDNQNKFVLFFIIFNCFL